MSQENPLETRELTQHVKIRAVIPSERQQIAVQTFVDSRGKMTKGEALRIAGYSKAIQKNPYQVFDSVAVQGLLQDVMKPEHILGRLKRHVYARRAFHMTLPTYNPEKAVQREAEALETGEDVSEQTRGEQMTDADIRDFLAGVNCTVYRIVHGEQARHVYYYGDDTKASLDAIEKFINLYGLYAPKKLDVKGNVQHEFSLTDLRKRMDEGGVEIIKPRVIDV